MFSWTWITTAHLLSGCDLVERDKALEQQALCQLSKQLYQFTPHIDRYCSAETAQSGLLLEISSCLKLFSGLKAMTEKLVAFLDQTPYAVDYGLAHSAKAAWLLSFDYHEVTGEETKSLFMKRLITSIANARLNPHPLQTFAVSLWMAHFEP